MEILLYIICGVPLVFVILHTLVRVIRHFYKFPMPEFMANLIDNPLRRKMQPPAETAIRHGIEPGMMVLDVGPGNGRYTIGAARRVGDSGKIFAIDIEPKMIERVEARAQLEGVTNIEARVANVYELPFEDRSFDLVYMITVISEIPDPVRAMQEFHRVLKPDGSLVFSELLNDPDYPLAGTLVRWAREADFRVKQKLGNFFYYTLIFEKNR
ncbi:MAG: class I SAM-dependent methyltransferase [Anaerolineales bacterium]|jgi:ubiquinone/menaquinone biosynthesis C-methylase UbiE